MKRLGRFAALLLAAGILGANLFAGAAFAAADTEVNEATGKASVSGHSAESALQYGTIVQLMDEKTKLVAPADGGDLRKMYGVTVDPHQLSLTLSDSSLQNEAYVATSGTFSVLVSTQEGTIEEGDYVTMSAIDGVGMKAGTFREHNIVFGRAAANFDGSNSVGQMTLKYDGVSDTQTVQLGLIPVAINIVRNPNDRSTKANLPEFLERLGQAIAEKQVSPIRIYLAIGVTGLTLMVALVTLHSGVKNAIVSIGRNPLTKKSIFRGLLEVILTGFLILIIGLFTVYLLLRL